MKQETSENDLELHDQSFMQAALAEARKAASRGEVPIGAVVVRDQQIIGRGYNLRETQKDPVAHAEILAIQEAARYLGGWRLINATLYVTVEPCFMCAGALILARIDRVVYGTRDAKFGGVDSLVNLVQFPGINHHLTITSGVCEEECRKMMQDFFRNLRRGVSS